MQLILNRTVISNVSKWPVINFCLLFKANRKCLLRRPPTDVQILGSFPTYFRFCIIFSAYACGSGYRWLDLLIR